MKVPVLLLTFALCLAAAPSRADEAVPAAAASDAAPRLALGVGYPDVRLRYAFLPSLSAEAKVAFSDGVQIYGARLYWEAFGLGPLKVMAGGEGGYVSFSGVEGLDGNGYELNAFAGLEWPIARRWRLNVDLGPAWLQANAEGQSYAAPDLVVNTALYFFLF